MEKTCTTCKKIKSVTEFNKNKRGKFGVHSNCRECMKTSSLKIIDGKIKKYEERLKTVVADLLKLKSIEKDLDPKIRVINNMTKLPELKEKVLNFKEALDDLREIRDTIKHEEKTTAN